MTGRNAQGCWPPRALWTMSEGIEEEPTYSRHEQPASGLSQKQSGVHPWRQSRQEAAGPSGGMADGDSTKMVLIQRKYEDMRVQRKQEEQP